MGEIRIKPKAAFLHRGTTARELCGGCMETRREQLARLCRTSCFLVDLLERVLQRAIPVSWMCWYDGVWFRAASRHETALRARGAASARWRGVPADAPPGDSEERPEQSAYGFLLGACWLVVARRRAGSRALREPTHENTDLCLRLLDVGLPMGCCTPAGFKFLPPLEYPPLAVSLFLEAAGNAFGCKCSAQKGPAATRLRHWCSAAGIYLV